jgi:hypothetical protein
MWENFANDYRGGGRGVCWVGAVGPVTYTTGEDSMKASRSSAMIAVLGSYKMIASVPSAENSFCDLLECDNM